MDTLNTVEGVGVCDESSFQTENRLNIYLMGSGKIVGN